jgi:hypothetical protein
MEIIRKVIKVIITLGLSLWLGSSVGTYLTNELRTRVTDKGIVVSKSSYEVAIEDGSETELYLNIQFDQHGFKSIKVEPTTYFQKSKGERVIFSWEEQNLHNWKFINYVLGMFIVWGIGFCGVIWFLTWVFKIKIDSDKW